MLAKVRVRKTVMSTAAVSEEGLFNNNLLLVETERAMMRAADRGDRGGRQHASSATRAWDTCAPWQAVRHLVVDSALERSSGASKNRRPRA